MTYDGRPARLLYGDDKSPQSGVALDDSAELLFDYNQRFMEIAMSVRPQKVLVIGGGAFSLPVALVERFPDVAVDAVEIDQILPNIARQFFDLTDNPRLNIIIADGREFIEATTSTYDMIIIDAFSGLKIPTSLLSIEAVRLYKSALNPGGLVAINIISAYHKKKPTLAHRLLATLETAFANVEAYPADYDGRRVTTADNLVLTASDNVALDFPYLQSAALEPRAGQAGPVHDSI